MGLPAVPVTLFKEYTRQVQSLLRGEDVLFRDGVRERWIRLMHTDHENFSNIKDPIPFYLAANGPKALEAVGELADGWVTVGAAARHLDDDYAAILQAAKRAGRSTAKPYTVALTSGCVLREGESLMSDRVIAQVGPNTRAPIACDVGGELRSRGGSGDTAQPCPGDSVQLHSPRGGVPYLYPGVLEDAWDAV